MFVINENTDAVLSIANLIKKRTGLSFEKSAELLNEILGMILEVQENED